MPRKDGTAPTREHGPYSGAQRIADGVTVTAVNVATGDRRTVARTGMRVTDGLREIAWQLDEWPGHWRIAAISTPTTIYRDLQGHREQRDTGTSGPKVTGAEGEAVGRIRMPEPNLLGQIGRLDLATTPDA